MKQNGLGMHFYQEGNDLSGDIGSLKTVASPRKDFDVTGLDKFAVERILGIGDPLIDYHGFFNSAMGFEHSVLSLLPTTNQEVVLSYGDDVNDPAAMLSALQMNYDWTRNADGSLSFDVSAKGDIGIPLEFGKAITAGRDVFASASSGAYRDDLAATNYGLAAQLQYFGRASGAPSALLEHSSDHSSWGTLINFGALGSTRFGARYTSHVATQVKRYLRLTLTGTFTNADLYLAVRRGVAADIAAY